MLDEPATPAYWTRNIVSLVLFAQGCHYMNRCAHVPANLLVEIGPSDALAGPIGQIRQELGSPRDAPADTAGAKRGPHSVLSIYHVANACSSWPAPLTLPALNRTTPTLVRRRLQQWSTCGSVHGTTPPSNGM